MGTTRDQPAGVTADPGGAPFSIFISYARGDDDGSARDVNKRLREAFPDDLVYFDVAEPSGTKWDEQLTHRLRDATVFLALVGPNWTSKLHPPRDGTDVSMWTEVVFALQGWKSVLLPVLISTPVPERDAVPRPLQGLFNRDCAELRHGSFDDDLERLVERLAKIRSGDTPVEVLEPRRGTADHPPPPWDEPEPSGDQLLRDLDEQLSRMASVLLDWPVVTILGPGAGGAPPETQLLAEKLKEDPDVSALIEKAGLGTADLAEIAQRAWQIGELRVHKAIEKVIAAHSQPTDVHRFLAGLPKLMRWARGESRCQMIVTTNCENALEQAFIDADEPYDQVVYVPKRECFVYIPWPEDGAEPDLRPIENPSKYQSLRLDDNSGLAITTIVKLHGAARQFGRTNWALDYIVTEDQYIDYGPQHLPQQVLELLTTSHVLLIGYRLREWSARVPLRRIWPDQVANESWAVAADLDDFDQKIWAGFGIDRVAAEPSELVRALYARIESRHTETVPG